jgi:hypothetical protein
MEAKLRAWLSVAAGITSGLAVQQQITGWALSQIAWRQSAIRLLPLFLFLLGGSFFLHRLGWFFFLAFL